jgi:chromosomal replication initiation ATPase DnaA
MLRGSEEEQLKLEYLVKKHLGEEKLAEGVKVANLFYRHCAPQDKLITDKEYLRIWLEENEGFRDDAYLLTPALLHELTIARRIHENTDHPVLLQGAAGSGKSVLFAMYRRLHHENSFYMQISPAEGSNWSNRLTASLQRHGLNSLGARINYQQSVLMVEDVHLADRASLQPLESMLFYGRCRVQKKEFQLKNVKFMLSGERCPEGL